MTNPRIWSLWNIMQEFDTFPVFGTNRTVAGWAKEKKSRAVVDMAWAARQAKAIQSGEKFFLGQGLISSWASLQRIVTMFDAEQCKWKDLAVVSEEFLERFKDETKGKPFFSLTPKELAFYRKPREGWEIAIARWPIIIDDVEEASKCYAFSRYPASVFHATQAVELALIELGKFIKVPDPKSGWTAVSSALNRILKKERKAMTPFEKRHFAFLEQLQGCVEGLKNAWRNKISHAAGRIVLLPGELNPDVTEEIMLASRAFVRRLAEGLPQQKPKRRRASEEPAS